MTFNVMLTRLTRCVAEGAEWSRDPERHGAGRSSVGDLRGEIPPRSRANRSRNPLDDTALRRSRTLPGVVVTRACRRPVDEKGDGHTLLGAQ